MNKRYRLLTIGFLCSAAMLTTGICHAATVLTSEKLGDEANVNKRALVRFYYTLEQVPPAGRNQLIDSYQVARGGQVFADRFGTE